MIQTNDNTRLEAQTSFDGPRLTFDFPGVQVGVAEYEEGPTGCTVFYFPGGVTTAVDERGGAIGAIGIHYELHHAFCFAGGSLLGLAAATGVQAELLAQRGYRISWESMPLVGGAIIWDWSGRDN